MDTVADVVPENHPKRQYVELWGAPLVLNAWLRGACGALVVLVLALAGALAYVSYNVSHLKPIVVRIDAVGRAEAVSYDASTWKPQIPELRFFLTRFVKLHRERLRATVARDYPDSLLFLDGPLSGAILTGMAGREPVQTFAENPSADEVVIEVNNVTFSNLSQPPYQAAVDFVERSFPPNSQVPVKSDTFTAQVLFVFRDSVPNHYVPVNPLGLQITQFRVDQAFTSTRSH